MTTSERTPIRTCVGCRRRKPASSMWRVTVDGDTGDLRFGGPSRGRGAWICSEQCHQVADRRGALRRALRSTGRPG